MTRFFGRHVAPEILGLLLVEFGLAFVLACAFLSPDSVGALRPGVAGQALAVALAVGFVSFLLGTYRPQRFTRTRGLLIITATGAVIAVPVVYGLGHLLRMRPDAPAGAGELLAVRLVLIWLAALLLVRFAFLAAVRFKLFVRRVAVLGPTADVAATVSAIRAGRVGFFEVVDAPAGAADPVAFRRAGIDHVLTTTSRHAGLSDAEKDRFAENGVELLDEPGFWSRHLKRISVAHLTQHWFDVLDRTPVSRVQLAINRAGDVAISLGLLIFTLPLMGLVALIVRLESPGPVLYRQERVGLGGQTFVVLKFRSMKANAEARGPAWAQARDPRVTRIGSLMRRTRIDELPQLINVLKGEMSFIGPRPERPHFVEQLAEVIPFYRERSRVKPGLTGWAQVNYPYGASVEDAEAKLSYDLYYVQNRSVWLDLATLFATVRVIVFQEGSR